MKAHPAYPVSDQGAYHHSWKLELPMSFKSYENLALPCPFVQFAVLDLTVLVKFCLLSLVLLQWLCHIFSEVCFMWKGSDKDEGSCIPGVL